MTELPNNGNTIEIPDLTTYIKEISEIRKESSEIGENKYLFSRGQKNIKWDILPTVFRENLLKDEAKIIKGAYARTPAEFSKYVSQFERLTKLQHYGLCTRLLDVTLNPMVSLYFACQKYEDIVTNEENQRQEKIEQNGAVYCQLDYGNTFDSIEVRILSAISEMDQEKITLKSCLERLQENKTLTGKQVETYKSNKYRELMKILQSNYFVISNFSNERLIRQSGAFLLPGCINIKIDEANIDESILQKATYNFKNEFTSRIFEIPYDAKSDILKELDLYNINEASLFPELEHQMRYIKSIHQNNAQGVVDNFSKIIQETPDKILDNDQKNIVLQFQDDEDKTKKIIKSSINKWIPPDISEEQIFKIFEDNLVVDWYKKEQIVSKIRKEIKRTIENSKRYTSDGSEKWANVIVNMAIHDLGKWDEVIKEKNAMLEHKED